jgi:hypothetical protein
MSNKAMMVHRPLHCPCIGRGCLPCVSGQKLGTKRVSTKSHGFVTKNFMQNIMSPVTVVNMAALLLSPLPFWFFISYLGWGLFGAAVAIVGTDAVCTASMVISTVWILTRYESTDPRKQAWPGFSCDAFKVSCHSPI